MKMHEGIALFIHYAWKYLNDSSSSHAKHGSFTNRVSPTAGENNSYKEAIFHILKGKLYITETLLVTILPQNRNYPLL